jgi:uncharacterized protein (TIGR00290 family)
MRPIVSWSGGKDCAWALHKLRQGGVEARGLLWISDGRGDRYFVPPAIIEMQARALGLPLIAVMAMQGGPERKRAIDDAYLRAAADGADSIAYGHIKPKAIERIHERARAAGLEAAFPLLGRDPIELAHEMIDGGIEAMTLAVDQRVLPATAAGRRFDRAYVAEMIALGVDPCGEGGAFNTVAVGGPPFPGRLDVETEVVDFPAGKRMLIRPARPS